MAAVAAVAAGEGAAAGAAAVGDTLEASGATAAADGDGRDGAACSVCWRLRAGLSSATGGSRRTRRERAGSSVRHCLMARRST